MATTSPPRQLTYSKATWTTNSQRDIGHLCTRTSCGRKFFRYLLNIMMTTFWSISDFFGPRVQECFRKTTAKIWTFYGQGLTSISPYATPQNGISREMTFGMKLTLGTLPSISDWNPSCTLIQFQINKKLNQKEQGYLNI